MIVIIGLALLFILLCFIVFFIEILIELIFTRIRINNGFIYTRGLIFFRNFIFMSLTKKAKKEFKKFNNIKRKKEFYIVLKDFLERLPSGKVYRTETHDIIKDRLEREAKKGTIKIVKCKKKMFPRPMIFNKFQIGNKNKFLEFKIFYKIEFIKI